MTYFKTNEPDPAWLTTIVDRRAILWIGPSHFDHFGASQDQSCELIAQPWLAVYSPEVLPEAIVADAGRRESLRPLTLREIKGDPDDHGRLARNRVPVYCLSSPEAPSPVLADFSRMKMFAKIPAQSTIFVLSEQPDEDLETLATAIELAEGEVKELIVVSKEIPTREIPARGLVHWSVDSRSLAALLEGLASPSDALAEEATIAIRNKGRVDRLDLSPAIDPSHPITDRFALVPHTAVFSATDPSSQDIIDLLDSPTKSWKPYSTGAVFDRTSPYQNLIEKEVDKVAETGPVENCTVWIDAQQASGASTMLRDLLVRLAQRGLPVLIARPEATTFDFRQLSCFLKAAADAADGAGTPLRDTPWIIAFDAEHAIQSDDFVRGISNGLRKLNQRGVVLAIRPIVAKRSSAMLQATGRQRTAGPPMLNILAREEVTAIGEHLNRLLPREQRRRSEEWRDFATDSERLTGDGRQSLFWLALRFWLNRVPGADKPLRQWLASQVKEMLAEHPDRLQAVLAIATLSRHRLAFPYQLLSADERQSIRPLLDQVDNPLGLRELWGERRGSLAFPHPLLAEELIRICATDADLLATLDISQCAGRLDLELKIFERLFARKEIGRPEVIPIVQELVVSGLRVDQRENPQVYFARDRIVNLLEQVPDAVFDNSPIFLHHLAKARRHLAIDPPDSREWQEIEVRREQLELAESHITEAIARDDVDDTDLEESRLNLHVSLALTLVARADLEKNAGDQETFSVFMKRADAEYAKAQQLDADNTYVLENFARLKIREANETDDANLRLQLIIEAITLLTWEQVVDAQGRREDAIMESLATAYAVLEDDIGLEKLRRLADEGSEAAATGLGKLWLRPDGLTESELVERAKEVVKLLKNIPSQEVTWRSRFLLYQSLTRIDRYDFESRLEALDELHAMTDFSWPLQVRLEYGILLHQLRQHEKGQKIFSELRDAIASRSGGLQVPAEMQHLTDPEQDFRKPLLTSLQVTRTKESGRDCWGIPEAWGSIEIPFRDHLFGRDRIQRGDDLPCLIRFSSFGPRPEPPTNVG